jgi:hypothetical protein
LPFLRVERFQKFQFTCHIGPESLFGARHPLVGQDNMHTAPVVRPFLTPDQARLLEAIESNAR